MKITGVWALLAALLLLITTVKGESGVSFWRKNFTMTCPEKADWYKDKEKLSNTTESLALQYNDASKGVYHCEYNEGDTKKYYFYVRGQVCENCFELDGFVIMGAIIGDVVITGCVSLLIYKWAKNKNSNAKPTTPAAYRAPGRSGPPVPSPDYEPLSARTRSADTYSTVNRMG
ncbi:T-cell surface glycoprotein CD3 epsilon chain-like isoform X2 [Myripristis murdjan]|uniref:T-cell surface glycoprotein CD3 epsilon chain-like isoform X2 n=1 Tax=Myripristis murdjan TaxID=586833 RepID=UPI0011763460|nr:T-cell surface glycoprotein CD3 epsilon chain isoform X2 [Myripristis murdjan]